MLKKNGSNKIEFDFVSFLNLLITLMFLSGAMFGFYLTSIEGRFDEIEKNDIRQTQDIKYIREAVARLEK